MFSGWNLLIILVIVLVLFGAKRLRNVGSDLGAAVKGFRSAVKDGEEEQGKGKGETGKVEKQDTESAGRVIDAEATKTEKKSD